MTIEQKAREIAFEAKKKFLTEIDVSDDDPSSIAARLGIIEGLEMAEQAVSQTLAFGAREAAVRAIRALIEEQKV